MNETRILMFHRVTPDRPVAFGLPACTRLRGTELTEAEFCEVLDACGPVIPLSAVERAISQGAPLPPGTVLTFDDGYREHLDLVAPLLEKRGHVGTFYVATGIHGYGALCAPVDAWYDLLDRAERPAAVVSVNGHQYEGRVDTLDGKKAWVMGAPKRAYLEAPPETQQRMRDQLAESLGVTPDAGLAARLYVTPLEWEELVARGHRVGAHSVTHPRLTAVGGRHLRREIDKSLAALRHLDPRPSFAYPDGAWDDRVVAALPPSVSSAVTCAHGPVTRDCLRLPRIFVSPPPPASRGAHVTGGEGPR